jgi:hypothetical protein
MISSPSRGKAVNSLTENDFRCPVDAEIEGEKAFTVDGVFRIPMQAKRFKTSTHCRLLLLYTKIMPKGAASHPMQHKKLLQ